MTIDELKNKIASGTQYYYHKDKIVEMLERINAPKSNKATQSNQSDLTLF